VRTELVLDEFGAIASDALCKVLAQARGFRLTAHLYGQARYQAPQHLRDELDGNTAIKLFGATDHPREAHTAASMASVAEAKVWEATIRKLPARHFVLIARGQVEPLVIFSPHVRQPWRFAEGYRIITQQSALPTVDAHAATAELAWRDAWIRRGGFDGGAGCAGGTIVVRPQPRAVQPCYLDDVPGAVIQETLRRQAGDRQDDRMPQKTTARPRPRR
jgi:hypothetical protein